jgi:hypothetical protein
MGHQALVAGSPAKITGLGVREGVVRVIAHVLSRHGAIPMASHQVSIVCTTAQFDFKSRPAWINKASVDKLHRACLLPVLVLLHHLAVVAALLTLLCHFCSHPRDQVGHPPPHTSRETLTLLGKQGNLVALRRDLRVPFAAWLAAQVKVVL